MRPKSATLHGNGQELSPCTMPFLLILPQVTGQNVHQQVSIPAQPCLCWPAIQGNIYSGLYCIYIHIVCGFPLSSHSDSATLSVYPLEQLLHPLAARIVVSVRELCFSDSRRIQVSSEIAWPHRLRSITWPGGPQALFCGQRFLGHCKCVVHS